MSRLRRSMSHVIWSFASGTHLLGLFCCCSAAQFWSRMQEEARVGWSLTSIPADPLCRPTPLCSMLGKTIFLKVDFHREALRTAQRKCPIQFPSLFPKSLTLKFTAFKSWSLNQTFLLLNSNYSGLYWFKVQCIMIATLIPMLISFLVLCFGSWGGAGIKFQNSHSILYFFMIAKRHIFVWYTYLSDILFLIYIKCFFSTVV